MKIPSKVNIEVLSRAISDSGGIREFIEDTLSNKYVMGTLTVVPAAVMFIVIVGGPILWAIGASFYRIPAFQPEWEWIGLTNYVEILSDEKFYSSFRRNLVFAFGTAFLNTSVGVVIALLLNREFRFKQIAIPIALLPYLIPTAFVGYFVLWIGNQQFGVVNQLLILSGIIEEADRIAWFTGDGTIAMITLFLAHNWKYALFVTILVLAKLQRIPDDLYEAAEMAGASMYQRFRDITLPNIQNVLFIVILLRGVWNFNKFDIIWVLTRGGPGDATTTLPVYAYELAFQFDSLGEASAVSVILFVILSIVAVIYFNVAEPSKEVRVE